MESFISETINKELPAAQERQKSPLDKTSVEKLLENGEVEIVSEVRGSSKVEILKFKDGDKAIFKSKSGEIDFSCAGYEPGTLYKRERAAYLIDRFLDFGLVPTTVIREIDGDVGSVQEFKDAKTASELSYEERYKVSSAEYGKLCLFDYIIWNTDRTRENYLIEDKTLWAIDNGLSFNNRPYSGVITESLLAGPPSPDTISKLKSFIEDEELKKALRGLLAECLSQQEIDACFARIEKIGKTVMKAGRVLFDFKLDFNPSK